MALENGIPINIIVATISSGIREHRTTDPNPFCPSPDWLTRPFIIGLVIVDMTPVIKTKTVIIDIPVFKTELLNLVRQEPSKFMTVRNLNSFREHVVTLPKPTHPPPAVAIVLVTKVFFPHRKKVERGVKLPFYRNGRAFQTSKTHLVSLVLLPKILPNRLTLVVPTIVSNR